MRVRAFWFVLISLVFGVATSSFANAEEMGWTFTSKYKYQVQVKLYSEDRRHVWPSKDTAWSLKDYASHTEKINCIRGEKICYGAWATGNASHYWGVGHGDQHNCDTCCAICGSGNVAKTLVQK